MQRDSAIDIAKGILALSVVYGHVFASGGWHSFIYCFHMPAFFVITGLLLRLTNETHKAYVYVISKTVWSIVIPYLFFEIVGAITYVIRFGFGQSLFGLVYNSLIMHCNNGPDWFLYVLLFAKIGCLTGLNGTKHISEKYGEAIYSCIAILLMTVAMSIDDASHFIGIVRKTIIAHGFIVFGYCGYSVLRNFSRITALLAIFLTFWISRINSSTDMSQLQFGNPMLFLVGALLGTYAVLQVGRMIRSKTIAYIGRGSLVVMGTHVPLLFLMRYLLGQQEFPGLMGMLVFLMIVTVEIPIIYVLENIVPFLIGRNLKMRKKHE